MEVVFQQKLKSNVRPFEEELNYHTMFTDNNNDAPQINDYVEFAGSVGGATGIYKVVSRYFQYFYYEDKNKYNVRCTIVVERDDNAAPKLRKE